jgi:transposase
MKSRDELLREFGGNPQRWADYAVELERHALELQRQIEQTQTQLAERNLELAQTAQQLAEAQALIADLKQQLFGAKAEKLTPEQEEQLQQVMGDVQDQAQRPPPLSQEVLQAALQNETKEQRQCAKARRRRTVPPVELEKQTVVLEPADKVCPISGKERPQIDQEVTTEYDFVAAKLIVRQIVRPKYGSCGQDCCPGVTMAALPPRLLPQSKLGLGLAVFLLLSRFDDHVAYYTLERNFLERFGAVIPRQQMVQWVEKIAHLLLAIYRLIWEELKASGYLQIDETPVRVLDPEVKGKAGQGYLWFFSNPQGSVFLEFREGRGRDGPEKRLKDFAGTIQSDAYPVYDSLRRQRPRTLRRIGCLSHSRRRFYKALLESCSEALWFIAQMRRLYRIEDALKDGSPVERRRGRLEQAPPIWLAMKRRAQALKADARFLPQSSLGKAVSYFLNEYTAMVGYLRDGRFEIDNNLVENDVRPSAVGRRRWLFIGHPDAGWRSAVIYTIIQSCRRHGVNTQEYLTDVLARLPAMTTSQVPDLLPSRWKSSRQQG